MKDRDKTIYMSLAEAEEVDRLAQQAPTKAQRAAGLEPGLFTKLATRIAAALGDNPKSYPGIHGDEYHRPSTTRTGNRLNEFRKRR